MILTVTDAEYKGGYILDCTFNNGQRKRVDLAPLLSYPAYQELADQQFFQQFGLEETIFWSNGADISPEYLFEHGVSIS